MPFRDGREFVGEAIEAFHRVDRERPHGNAIQPARQPRSRDTHPRRDDVLRHAGAGEPSHALPQRRLASHRRRTLPPSQEEIALLQALLLKTLDTM